MATPCRSLVTTSQAFLRACEASFRSTLHWTFSAIDSRTVQMAFLKSDFWSDKYYSHCCCTLRYYLCCTHWTNSLYNPQEGTSAYAIIFIFMFTIHMWISINWFEDSIQPLVTQHDAPSSNGFLTWDFHFRVIDYFSTISHFTSVLGFRVCLTVCMSCITTITLFHNMNMIPL